MMTVLREALIQEMRSQLNIAYKVKALECGGGGISRKSSRRQCSSSKMSMATDKKLISNRLSHALEAHVFIRETQTDKRQT